MKIKLYLTIIIITKSLHYLKYSSCVDLCIFSSAKSLIKSSRSFKDDNTSASIFVMAELCGFKDILKERMKLFNLKF